MGGFSLVHWLLFGVVVLLLFGKNRFSDMMGDVAKGIKSFKKGISEDDEPAPRRLTDDKAVDLTADRSRTTAAEEPREP